MIKLNDDQLEKVGKIARGLRPAMLEEKENLYNLDSENRIKLFLYCFRFLFSLKERVEEDGLKKEFEKIIKNYLDLFNIAVDLYLSKNREISFNMNRRKIKLDDFICDNKEEIDSLIDFVYPLGKRVILYDPDQHVGIMDE